jgi:aspartate/methionine/tyrosine aminotransferase
VIVVHPNNPTGHFAKAAEIAKLNALCSAHQMAIIADEVFLDYSLDKLADRAGALRANHQPSSFAANTDALTFTMSGLSKISGLPQMKAAWLIVSGPQQWKRQALARLEVIADTYLSMNAPVQLAIPVFLEQRHAFQGQLLSRVQQNLAELDRQLGAQKVCSRLVVEGGWYAVLRVPATQPDEDLAIHLLTTKGIYIYPGHFYDFSSDGHLILSLITDERAFCEGTTQLFSLLRR